MDSASSISRSAYSCCQEAKVFEMMVEEFTCLTTLRMVVINALVSLLLHLEACTSVSLGGGI